MGMTDKQFDAFIKQLVRNLEKAIDKGPDNKAELQEILRDLQDILKS